MLVQVLGRACCVVERTDLQSDEWDAMVDLNVQLARVVTKHNGAPLVLAGSCNLGLGVLAGLRCEPLGIIWFDAHGDFNTPETSLSGRLDGMALAIATGKCHNDLRQRIGLGHPVSDANVLLVETRDLDPGEALLLERSSVEMVSLGDLPGAVTELATRVSGVYLHIDADVLDPAESPGANCSKPGGIAPRGLYDALRMIGSRIPVAAAALANFNPDRDREDRTLRILERVASILGEIVEAAA
jgi:arginase